MPVHALLSWRHAAEDIQEPGSPALGPQLIMLSLETLTLIDSSAIP